MTPNTPKPFLTAIRVASPSLFTPLQSGRRCMKMIEMIEKFKKGPNTSS